MFDAAAAAAFFLDQLTCYVAPLSFNYCLCVNECLHQLIMIVESKTFLLLSPFHSSHFTLHTWLNWRTNPFEIMLNWINISFHSLANQNFFIFIAVCTIRWRETTQRWNVKSREWKLKQLKKQSEALTQGISSHMCIKRRKETLAQVKW